MRQLGEQLLEVHGQFDGRGLMDRRTHRAALDEFGRLGGLADETRTAFSMWQMKERALADAMASSEQKPTRLPSCNVRLKNCRPWQLYPVKSGTRRKAYAPYECRAVDRCG